MIQKVKLEFGTGPLVVGTITRRDWLPSGGHKIDYTCDIVEIRLDQIGLETSGWRDDIKVIEEAGIPVLVTLRLVAEGGAWARPDLERLPFLASALEEASCIDVEYLSETRIPLCAMAKGLGKPVIVSYHNFERTPALSELEDILGQIRESSSVAIPKITTMVLRPEDVVTLENLLGRNQRAPLCVMGMGDLGTQTRVLFPSLGSCLTYGYLDAPSAPGQLPAARLKELIAGGPRPPGAV